MHIVGIIILLLSFKGFTEYTDFAGTGVYATLADAKAKKNKIIDASDGSGAVDSMNAYLLGVNNRNTVNLLLRRMS